MEKRVKLQPNSPNVSVLDGCLSIRSGTFLYAPVKKRIQSQAETYLHIGFPWAAAAAAAQLAERIGAETYLHIGFPWAAAASAAAAAAANLPAAATAAQLINYIPHRHRENDVLLLQLMLLLLLLLSRPRCESREQQPECNHYSPALRRDVFSLRKAGR